MLQEIDLQAFDPLIRSSLVKIEVIHICILIMNEEFSFIVRCSIRFNSISIYISGKMSSLNTNEFLKLIEKYYTDRIQNDARIQHTFLTL